MSDLYDGGEEAGGSHEGGQPAQSRRRARCVGPTLQVRAAQEQLAAPRAQRLHGRPTCDIITHSRISHLRHIFFELTPDPSTPSIREINLNKAH